MTPEIEKATQDWITAERDYNNAEQGFKTIKDQLQKGNLDYVKVQQKIKKLDEQHEELEAKCDEIEDQTALEEWRARRILETLESNWDYKMAKNNLIGAQDKLDSARNYLERLIATEAEK